MSAAFDITSSFQEAVNSVFNYLPKILAFLVILVIGYIIAKIVKGVLNKLLEKVGIDRRLTQGRARNAVSRMSPDGKPSHLVGVVAFWVIFVYALSAAIGALQIPALTNFMNQVLGYLPNVFAALLILLVAAGLAGVVVAAVQKTVGDTPTGKIVETVVPTIIMAIAVFMILTQLHIAPSIVIITYAALLGTLGLAAGLAFGLGGREVAGQLWSNAYQKGQQQTEQVKADAQAGRQRAQQQAQQAQQARQSQGDESSAGARRY